jgi:1,4-dihydroxy-2-naphthoyl-CoA hydrolase
MAFIYSRTVYLGDTDAAGVVYFARAMEICHEAYEESLRVMGISLYQLLSETAIAIPIVHTSINFFNPIFAGDKLVIYQVANLLKDSEFSTAYEIVAPNSPDKALVTATIRHVSIDVKTRERVHLPEQVINWIDATKDNDY